MTRARDNLTLGVPLRFYVTQQSRRGDRHLYAVRTRFLPREVLEHFETVHWAPPAPTIHAAPGPGSIDVAARMRAMWG
jgi:DNA helicase II / ATP-dependent DNA helicase PcrA